MDEVDQVDREDTPRRIPLWVWVLVVVGIWSVPALMEMAGRLYVPGSPNPAEPWYRVFAQQAPVWYLWAALTPLLIYLAKRFPIEEGRVRRNIAVHAGLSVVIGVAHFFASFALRALILGHNVNTAEYHDYFWFMLRYTTHLHILVYWVGIGAVHTFRFYRQYQDRKLLSTQLRAELMESQVSALRMQIQPHFLFNTLHTIANLMRHDQKDQAITMIADLSALLRRASDSLSQVTHTLGEELEFTRLYLSIMQTRFEDRLDIAVNETEEASSILVPVFLLQPIVENAFKHGLDPSVKGGRLTIETRLEDSAVVIRVFNDGRCLAEGHNWMDGSGTGLRNTKQRLEAQYGAAARFDLRNADGGVEALIRLPRAGFSP